jgi:hypothetical protein
MGWCSALPSYAYPGHVVPLSYLGSQFGVEQDIDKVNSKLRIPWTYGFPFIPKKWGRGKEARCQILIKSRWTLKRRCSVVRSLQDPGGKDVRPGETLLQTNVLRANPRYQAQRQLNSGTSANVILALDRKTGNEVCFVAVQSVPCTRPFIYPSMQWWPR